MPTLITGVALLRGVNVGGKNKLAMADLTAIFTAAGCSAARTYIQSGNVVYAASPAVDRRLPSVVSAEILKRFGLTVPVITRQAAELRRLIASNPYPLSGDLRCLHVGFLAETPERGRVKALNPDRSPGDSFSVVGREIFLHLPRGVARTKLTNAWFDGSLGTVSTLRNWRTVVTLAGMAAE